MQLIERITIDNQICNGKPTIRGHRLTVQTVVEFLLSGSTDEEVLEAYPFLEADDLMACRVYTLRLLDHTFSVSKIAA